MTIISVVHLEPATRFEDNSYNCSRLDKSDAIIVNENEKYEIRQLLHKHTYWQGHEYIIKYLAHWVGYSFEFDSWVNIKDLIKAQKLVHEFECEDRRDIEAVLRHN